MRKEGLKRVLEGVVTSNKADKTVTVLVTRTVRHPKYNKFMKRSSKYYAHDEKNEGNTGDKVLIEESRPLSKTKRWRLKEVVQKVAE